MSPVPTRRPSTGGKPPIRIRENYVVEEVSSHDSTPCFTAWIRKEIIKIPEGWSLSDYADLGLRPEWSVQIYDITSQSDNLEHLKTLAETLHRETREEREVDGRPVPDRIDVWGMPLAADTTDKERIAKCKAHILAEVASRNTTGDADFQIPQLMQQWQRALIIIDQPQELWNGNEGGFLVAFWDIHPNYLELLGKDHEVPETTASRYTLTELGRILADFRKGV
ncbi:hypothetical protein GQ53DRAFT_743323 [Thozetella sp. PMI_491]|nr:hypothetical protein GQ53DRAFT_743323 [Thozetella sp. PMI_491]